MRKWFSLRRSVVGVTVLAVAAALLVFFTVGAFAGGGTGCPSLSGKQSSTDINASFTDKGGGNATYSIVTPNDSPSNGVPGLIQYCVFTQPIPDSAVADYAGWAATTPTIGTLDFAYSRPDGNPSNLPFDGNTYDVGSATWISGTVPSNETILLHINDPAECNALYSDGSQTCWVFPSGGGTTPAADLTVTKTATPSFNRDYDWSVVKSQTTSPGTPIDTSASSTDVAYQVQATWSGPTDSGWEVTGNITVTNPNGFDFTGVTITDAVDNGGTCSVTDTNGGLNETVPADDFITVPYSCSYTSAPTADAGTNTATASWDKTAFNTPDSSAQGQAGFTFDDGSSGNPTVTHDTTTVTDTFNKGTPDTLGVAGIDGSFIKDSGNTLANWNETYDSGSQTFTFTYTRSVAVPSGSCQTYDNTATVSPDATSGDNSSGASVEVCGGADLTVSKTAAASFDRTYDWSVLKSQTTSPGTPIDTSASSTNVAYQVQATWSGPTDSNWKVTGDITVTNPNTWEDVPLTGLTDSIGNGDNCTLNDPTQATATVPAGESIDVPYTCTYASAPDPAAGTNTATATWDATAASTPDGTNNGTAAVDFSKVTPTITHDTTTVTDKFNGGTPDTLGVANVNGTFTKDAGNNLANWTESYDGPSQTFTFTYTRSVAVPSGSCQTYDNTATVSPDATSGDNSSGASVEVCGGADLTVSKTATPAFNRDYDWSVLKKQTTSTTPINSSASSVTVGYKVTATWSGPNDSGWTVTGTITVHNPNSWESVTLTGVTDAINNGGSCTVSGNTAQTIAASSDSTGLTYSCTYSSAPSPSAFTNTATATWDAGAASTPDGSAKGTATGDFSTVNPTVTHNTTTVKDAFNGGTAVTLGVANVNGTFTKDAGNNLANWTSSYTLATKTFTFTYTRSVPVVANTCKEYDNTASISPDATSGDNSSSAKVIVCGPITGGLTIGFWSNNNGRAVICAHDPGWRQLLNGTATSAPYNGGSYLRNANGTIYTVPTSGNCTSAQSNFASWLLGANSSNASYMLSAQLAGAILNVNFNGMNGNACIAGNGGTPTTINNLITTVIAFLKANGNTTNPSAARTLAVTYQTILASLNQGQGFAVSGC